MTHSNNIESDLNPKFGDKLVYMAMGVSAGLAGIVLNAMGRIASPNGRGKLYPEKEV